MSVSGFHLRKYLALIIMIFEEVQSWGRCAAKQIDVKTEMYIKMDMVYMDIGIQSFT